MKSPKFYIPSEAESLFVNIKVFPFVIVWPPNWKGAAAAAVVAVVVAGPPKLKPPFIGPPANCVPNV